MDAKSPNPSSARHYLIERLLVDKLGFHWADADDEAERLEHSLSPKLETFLFDSLGEPDTCPHGNPFPGSPGEAQLLGARRMTDTRAGESVTVRRITEEGEDDNDLLHFAHDNGLLPGARAQIEEVDLRAGQVSLRLDGRKVDIPSRWGAAHPRVRPRRRVAAPGSFQSPFPLDGLYRPETWVGVPDAKLARQRRGCVALEHFRFLRRSSP